MGAPLCTFMSRDLMFVFTQLKSDFDPLSDVPVEVPSGMFVHGYF